jgi:hypothetical protein
MGNLAHGGAIAYAKEDPPTRRARRNIMQTKDEVLEELRTMFRNVLAMTAAGGNHARLSRARGTVDGYMRALLDLGIATRAELLDMVTAERERANGPATGLLDSADADEGVAA